MNIGSFVFIANFWQYIRFVSLRNAWWWKISGSMHFKFPKVYLLFWFLSEGKNGKLFPKAIFKVSISLPTSKEIYFRPTFPSRTLIICDLQDPQQLLSKNIYMHPHLPLLFLPLNFNLVLRVYYFRFFVKPECLRLLYFLYVQFSLIPKLFIQPNFPLLWQFSKTRNPFFFPYSGSCFHLIA